MTDDAAALVQDPNAEMSAVGVYVGQILAGKYRVDRVLGLGGMGIVVKATHEVLGTDVAVKFLLPEFVNDNRITSRFLREAKAVVSIKNPHVAGVIDVGTLDSGSPYIVMEFLKGRDLEDVIQAEGCIQDFDRGAQLVLQACEGLAAAHAVGIIHRDIKPGNLFLTRASDGTEQVKVLDFGISKNDQELSGLTQTGTIMGSPMYMSPEQMRSTRNVDERTDIWSLGVVAFQMLTGRLPYDAETMTELVAMVIEYEPPRVSTLRPDVPPLLDEIVATAMAKKVAERYPSVGHLANDLAAMLGDHVSMETAARTQRILANSDRSQSFKLETPGTVTRPGMGVSVIRQRSMAPAAASNTAEVAAPTATAGSNRTGLILGGIALIVALGGVAWVATRTTPAPAPVATQPATTPTPPVAAPAPAPAPAPTAVGTTPVAVPVEPAAAPAPVEASDQASRTHSRTTPRVTPPPAPTPTTGPAPRPPSPVDPFSDRN